MVKRFILSPLLLIACGPSASDTAFLREDGGCLPGYGCTDGSFLVDTGPITIPDAGLEPWDASSAGLLSGIFAVEATVTARAGIEVTSKQLYRLRIAQDGTHIHQKTTLCALSLPDIPNVVSLSVPPKLQALIEATSSEDDGEFLSNGQVLEAKYSPPPFLEVFGATLANPATDPLPNIEGGAAPDDDNDGNPGVTLLAQTITCTSAQQLYVALRVAGVLQGTVQTPDLITGYAQIHLDESVVGFSDPCLSVATTISIKVEPDSPFRAQRVDHNDAYDVDHNGNVSCPEIVINAPNIFADWNQ
jgi:hypothetical protein